MGEYTKWFIPEDQALKLCLISVRDRDSGDRLYLDASPERHEAAIEIMLESFSCEGRAEGELFDPLASHQILKSADLTKILTAAVELSEFELRVHRDNRSVLVQLLANDCLSSALFSNDMDIERAAKALDNAGVTRATFDTVRSYVAAYGANSL